MTLMDPAIDLAVVALIGGLLGLDRRAAFQLMVSQPLVAVTILGAYFGDIPTGATIGAILQLLWMSCVTFGANVPENDTVGAVTIGASGLLFSQYIEPADQTTWLIITLIGAPTCLLGKWLEVRFDQMNLSLAERADEAARAGDSKAIAWVICRALLRVFFANAALVASATAMVIGLTIFARSVIDASLHEGMIVVFVYALPALGLAVTLGMIRHRRALLASLVVFGLFSFLLVQGTTA